MSYSILVNDIPPAPFQAKQGLRQGHPLSVFLFALSIEYLRRYLVELQNDPNYNFHPKCERIHLNYLMFVDGLLIFARNDHSSLGKIMAAFCKFFMASCLEASIEKSGIYIVGVLEEEARNIAAVVYLPMCELPFRYLGVPLSAKKLNYT